MATYQGRVLRLPPRLIDRGYCSASGRNDCLSQRNERAVDRGDCGAAVRLSTDSFSALDLFNRPLGVCIIWVELHRFPIGIERALLISRTRVGFAQAVVGVPGVRVGP